MLVYTYLSNSNVKIEVCCLKTKEIQTLFFHRIKEKCFLVAIENATNRIEWVCPCGFASESQSQFIKHFKTLINL